MRNETSSAWEQSDLSEQECAAFLVAWVRSELSPHGGLFRMGTRGFRTSGRIQPFLSNVLGSGDNASEVLNHVLRIHPREAPSLLVSLGSHAKSAEGELGGVGQIGGPVQAKQMVAAMLRYSISLGELVEQCNRSVIDSLQAGLPIRAVTESNANDTLIRWLTICVELATGEHPVTKALSPTRELADLLVSSIRAGRLDDTLRLPLTEREPVPPLEVESEWRSIATGDEDDIESCLIALAGLDDAWYESGLNEQFSFMDDVLEHTSAAVESESDEDQPPGRSFIVYEVHVQDVAAFRDELRERIYELAESVEIEILKERT